MRYTNEQTWLPTRPQLSSIGQCSLRADKNEIVILSNCANLLRLESITAAFDANSFFSLLWYSSLPCFDPRMFNCALN